MLVGAAEWLLRRQQGWRDVRADVREVLRENEGRTVEVSLGGFSFTAGGITSGGGSSGGSSGSRSGGSFGGSSGGFSGGGGSLSGGGASGGW